MSAEYYGPVKWTCYNDCQMSSCPGHEATLYDKHGGYYLVYGDGRRADIDSDINLINAISWTLWRYRGLVSDEQAQTL